MRFNVVTRALLLLTVLVGGAVLLAGRPADVRASIDFIPPWGHWDNGDCTVSSTCFVLGSGVPYAVSSTSSDTGPDQAQSSAGMDSYFAGFASVSAWTEQGEPWTPTTSGQHRVTFQYSYDGSAAGSATLGAGVSALSAATAGVTVTVVDSGGASVVSKGEPVYEGEAISLSASDQVSYDDVFQDTLDTTVYVNLNAGEQYLFKGRLDVSASALSGFSMTGVPVTGQALAQVDVQGRLVSVTIVPQPDIALEYSPQTAPPGEFTPIDLTFRNVGTTTLESPAYYYPVEDFKVLAVGQPDLLPGETATFNTYVDTRPYTCSTMTKHAEVIGEWAGGQEDHLKYFPVNIEIFLDSDDDLVCETVDNCPSEPNADQTNTDAQRRDNGDVGFGAGTDASNPDGDAQGDVCDDDRDNDYMLDTGPHPTLGTPGEDVGCGSGPTDPLNPDSDGDGILDGAECLLGSDPLNGSSKPPAAPAGDGDGDGLPAAVEDLFGSSDADKDSDNDGFVDGLEVKGYGTSPMSADSEGDACEDWTEIVDVNGNRKAELGDVQAVILRALAGAPGDAAGDAVLDLNKNGVVINELGDVFLAILNSDLVKPHGTCGPDAPV